MNVLEQAVRLTRWQDWGPGKITLLCSLCFYIAAAYKIGFYQFLLPLLFFLVFASAQAALGFMVNNWGDRELDREQGKLNPFNVIHRDKGLIYLSLMIGLAILSAIPFVKSFQFIFLWGLWVFTMAAYSLKPLRLKTRGFWGLLVSFCAQWSLPVLLAFTILGKSGGYDMWLLAVALTISGATLEVAHQRHDKVRDAESKAKTFGAGLSQSKLDRIYALAVVLDKTAVGVVSTMVVFALLSFRTWWSVIMAVMVGCLVLALLLFTLSESVKACYGGIVQDPYYSEGRSLAKLLHETVPNFLLPFTLVLVLSFYDWLYLTLFAMFFFWRVVLGKADWKNPLRKIGILKE